MDLRKLLKKFGSVGLSTAAVTSYTRQMVSALKHLKECGILHADLKPDNLLVTDSMSTLKICDFGSASLIVDCDITPYLVSRFYRAPEIILGMRYDHQIDLWSLGCVVYELFTGRILFDGATNNAMLMSMQQIKGRFSLKMLRRAEFAHLHFDAAGVFEYARIDSATQATFKQKMTFTQPTKRLHSMLKAHAAPNDDAELIALLADFIEDCLILDPTKRPTVQVLMKHRLFETAAAAAPSNK